MGCCASTNTCRPPNISTSRSVAAKRCNNISKSPPPTHPISEEEEAVKEVLSETHKHFPIVQDPRPIFPLPDFSIAPHDKRPQPAVRRPAPFANHDPAEICSNPIESAAIFPAKAETREINGGGLRQRSPVRTKERPFPGEVKRERIAGNSPGRRSEISPIRSGSGYRRKRESGEISGRRSRSPVLRTDATSSQGGLSRTQSARKTGRSPGRAGRKVEEEKQDAWPPTTNESLENPLVSLECFIFL